MEKIQLLIIDDNPIDRQHYKQCLKKNETLSFILHESPTCQAGLKILLEHDIDCLLIDHYIPGKNGLEFLKEIQKQDRYQFMAIVFLTGQGNENIAVEAIKYGADDYMKKSEASVEKLNHSIHQALEKKALKKKIIDQHSELKHMAHYDVLTECLNRNAFYYNLSKEINGARRYGRIIALLFIDLDHFKNINDHYGHDVGDAVLVESVQRLQNSSRDSDILGRLGGDEFALLLTDVSEAYDVGRVAKTIINHFRAPFVVKDRDIYVGASIGIACFPESADGSEKLMQSADIAMYRAKTKGRNQYEYFSEELDRIHQKRMILEQDLNVALAKDQFFLMYQPQYRLEDDIMSGMEVLLRWDHPEKGSISPELFVSVAEDTGIIREIGQWVLEASCQQFRTWLDKHQDFPKISVNVSPKQFCQKNFVSNL